MALGGRQIPKKIRPQLVIDGEPTIEHDYPQLHPNMLYAEIGARLEGDAYAVDGWPRHVVKVAFRHCSPQGPGRAWGIKLGRDDFIGTPVKDHLTGGTITLAITNLSAIASPQALAVRWEDRARA
jgi:hypothetical protein